MKRILGLSLFISVILASCKNKIMKKDIKAPIADKIVTKLEKHGDVREDNYFWMRLSDAQKNAENKDEQTQKVYDYLNAENKYYE